MRLLAALLLLVSATANAQIVRQGVRAVGASGSSGLSGAVTLSPGNNVSITQTGQSVFFSATGSGALSLATKTANYTLSASDTVILANCSANCAMTLESAATGGSGTLHYVKRIGSAAVTFTATSPQTIDGQTTTSLSAPYQSITVISDGSNWHVL